LVVFVALGLTATSLGALMTEHRTQLVLVGGLVIFLFGLKLLGALNIGWLEREKRIDDRRLRTRFHLVNALVMGMVFGLGWTPCIGPILGSVLTYAASKGADPARGALYLATYGLGLVLPLLVLSLFAGAARALVQRMSRHLPKIEKISGGLLLVVGLVLMLGVTEAPRAEVSEGPGARERATISPPLGQPTARPRMVQFTSADCSICRQMIPTVAVIERDCDGRKVDLIKVDVTVAANKRLAATHRVRGVPTFLFLDAEGHEAARMVGYQTLASLRQALATMVGEQCDGVGVFDPGAPPDASPGASPGAPPGVSPGAACDESSGERCGG
jgi:cytochrome c-type biogenesis protein